MDRPTRLSWSATVKLNHTHDPERRSWVSSANVADTDFPLQNLPFGVFEAPGRSARGGVAIGSFVLDLDAALKAKLIRGGAADVARAAARSDLGELLALGRDAASILRSSLFSLLEQSSDRARAAQSAAEQLLVPLSAAKLLLPLSPTSFTDFCCSLYHIERMGRGRPDHPAWKRIPVAYNGRASSVRASGHPVRRPRGQLSAAGSSDLDLLQLRAEPMLDFELELGAWLSSGSELGEPIRLADAEQRIFGHCLVNDWSARAIQFFEMALGPFLGKSFMTTISPWIVTAEALWPFRAPTPGRTHDQPAVPKHLRDSVHAADGGYDIQLEAVLRTAAMQRDGARAEVITRTNSEHLHWSFAQMICHQASNGGNLCLGDLVASGTVSGPSDVSRACFAELTERGERPIELRNGETRRWLEDGDELTLHGRAAREGFTSIGFGECQGAVVPAVIV
jgi:fumarylacetoacetase